MTILEGMLSEVEISDFRAITSLRIPLTKINILVGRNNTGKTTVIEALALLLSSFNEYEDFIGRSILDLVAQHRGKPEYLVKMGRSYARISATLDTGRRITLYILKDLKEFKEIEPEVINGIEQALDLIADSAYQEKVSEIERKIKALKYRTEHQLTGLFTVKGSEEEIDTYKRKLDEYLKNRDRILSLLRSYLRRSIALCTVSLVDNTVANVYLRMKQRRFSIYEGEEVELDEENRVYFTNLRLQPISVRMYGDKSLIEKLEELPIERVIELIEKLRTLIPYFYDYRNGMVILRFGERKDVVPINVVGDGLLALLELFTPSIYGVRINLIEEPELHMHPGFLEAYTRELTKFAKERNIQYIMTTHSLEFLEYLLNSAKQQEMLNEVSVIRLYRLPDGEIDYEVLSGEEAYDELEDLKGDLRGP